VGDLRFINREAEVWDIANRRISKDAEPAVRRKNNDQSRLDKLANMPYLQGLIELEMFGDSNLLDDEMFKEIALFGTQSMLEEYRVECLAFSPEQFDVLKGECMRIVHERRGTPQPPAIGRIEQ
jgi:hypothetical protein